MSVLLIAEQLAQDLDNEGLERYLKNQTKMIENEAKNGRYTEMYIMYAMYRDAAHLAWNIKLREKLYE